MPAKVTSPVLVPPIVPLAVELRVKPFKVKSWEKRLVDEAVVEKRLVVVAEVPVAFWKVKFCKVVEPITNKSPDEFMVEVAEPPILN